MSLGIERGRFTSFDIERVLISQQSDKRRLGLGAYSTVARLLLRKRSRTWCSLLPGPPASRQLKALVNIETRPTIR